MSTPYIYDAFISYVGADQARVQRELLPRLAAAGLSYTLFVISFGGFAAKTDNKNILRGGFDAALHR